jgi:dienelactone hydrolase
MNEKLLETSVRITVDTHTIEGDLAIPKGANGIVLFAHGAGSSRHSPRNNFVAEKLQAGGLGTLLMDLLTPEEKKEDQRNRQVRFDVDHLGRRVTETVDWLQQPETRDLMVGFFGSSTGAAGALIAAAERQDQVHAVVSRGGRVDLAQPILDHVRAPTLLIAGENDVQVLSLNRDALQLLAGEKTLKIVSGAGHLFQEPGALEEVARLSRAWFQRYLGE